MQLDVDRCGCSTETKPPHVVFDLIFMKPEHKVPQYVVFITQNVLPIALGLIQGHHMDMVVCD